MNIVYLVFGNQLAIHQQANFSILTVLANGGAVNKIIVITDAPEYYANIASDKLVLEIINADTLQKWKGVHNYIFRAKIKALAHIIHKYPNDSLLYLDADTCVVKDLEKITKQLFEGYFAMHINEGIISNSKRNTQKSIWKMIQSKTLGNIKVPQNLCMWNAGIIGIPAQNNEVYINQVLQLNDTLCQLDVKIKLMEQLSFSILLQQQDKFIECEKEIKHYWGNKDRWNVKINTFFLNNHLKNLNFKDAIAEISKFNFYETPVFVKKSNTAKRLKQMIDKIF